MRDGQIMPEEVMKNDDVAEVFKDIIWWDRELSKKIKGRMSTCKRLLMEYTDRLNKLTTLRDQYSSLDPKNTPLARAESILKKIEDLDPVGGDIV
jgi:hypothetical protein